MGFLYKGPGSQELRLPGSARPSHTHSALLLCRRSQSLHVKGSMAVFTDTSLRRQAHIGLGLGVYLLSCGGAIGTFGETHRNVYS